MTAIKIFVVEDESIVLLEIQERLKYLGYEIAGTAISGEEAIEKIAVKKPDLVLMDIMLKGKIDGIEASEIILRNIDVPIIFITAYSEDSTIQRAKNIQPYGYIIKPFNEKDLYTTIEIAIHKHRLQKELTEKDRWLSTILKSIGDAVIAIDKNGRINFINKAAERLTGFSANELFGSLIQQSLKIFDYSTKKELNEYFERILTDGPDSVSEAQIMIISKDGVEKSIRESVSPILDERGNLIGVVLVFQDVSDRKIIEEKLRLQSSALNSAFNGVFIADKKGIIVWCNDAVKRLTGYEKEELIGNSFKILKSGIHDKNFYDNLWKTILAGKVWEGEIVNKKKDGSYYHEEMTITPVSNENGETINYIAIKYDITQRKKWQDELIKAKDEAEKSNRLKSEFLTQLSHEIRTPVNSILSFSNLLRDELKDKIEDDLKFSFDMIEKGGRRLIRTIDLILDMSTIQIGSYESNFCSLKLYKDIIIPVLNEYEYSIKNKKIKLLIDNRLDENCSVRADKYSVSQIFSNLMDNAVKYTEKGEIKVHSYYDSNNITIKICDTGIGISEEYMPHLFKPFRQEEQGYTRSFEGNGLGLALVKSYCDINNIDISVQSIKNLGTTFTLKFMNGGNNK